MVCAFISLRIAHALVGVLQISIMVRERVSRLTKNRRVFETLGKSFPLTASRSAETSFLLCLNIFSVSQS